MSLSRLSGPITLAFLLAVAASCGKGGDPDGVVDGGDTGPGEDASTRCDGLQEPCAPFRAEPRGACRVEGTAPGALPQVELERVADSPPEGALLDLGGVLHVVSASGAVSRWSAGAWESVASLGLTRVLDAARGDTLTWVTHLEGSDLVLSAFDDAWAGQVSRRFALRDVDVPGGAVAVDGAGHVFVGVGVGSDGLGLLAQDPDDVRGSILRFSVTGATLTVPPDNPFVDNGRGAAEVYATGWRNPVGCTWSTAQTLLCVDEGAEWAEVNAVESGANFGHPTMDGPYCAGGAQCDTDRFTRPVDSYRRSSACPVRAGTQVGDDVGPELDGAYLWPSCEGHLRAFRIGDDSRTERDIVAGLPAQAGEVASSGGRLFVAADGLHEIGVPAASSFGAFPQKLSETGCFDSLWPPVPAAGVVPFEVTSPLWTDGAIKRRFLALPPGANATTDGTGRLEFPPGTVLLKIFGFERAGGGTGAVEVRVMRRESASWSFHTYEVEPDGTDASVLAGKLIKDVEVAVGGEEMSLSYLFPDRTACRACHGADMPVLGPEVSQLSRLVDYGDGPAPQMDALVGAGVIDSPAAAVALTDPGSGEPAEARARSWLHANCSHCHRPGGWTPPDLTMDLRYSTPLSDAEICGVRVQYQNPTVQSQMRVAPGDLENSSIYVRATMRGLQQMPPMATEIVDPVGEEALREWIEGLSCE